MEYRKAKYGTAGGVEQNSPQVMTELTRKLKDVADELEDVLYEIVMGSFAGFEA